MSCGLECDPQVKIQYESLLGEGDSTWKHTSPISTAFPHRTPSNAALLISPSIRCSLTGSALNWIAIGEPADRQRDTFLRRPPAPHKSQLLLSPISCFLTPLPIHFPSRCGKPRPRNAAQAFVLHQRLVKHMWWGVAISIGAMVLVSVTNFVASEDIQPHGAKNPCLGAFFILLSCFVQASYSCYCWCCCFCWVLQSSVRAVCIGGGGVCMTSTFSRVWVL